MSERSGRPPVRPQPMIAVADVQQASRCYQQVFGATSGYGGPEYEQLMVGGELDAQIVTDVHLNPNAGPHEIWIRDLDGYLVVFAEPPGWSGTCPQSA